MIKENSGIRKTDVINRRMFIIGAAKLIIFSGIVSRLFFLQIGGGGGGLGWGQYCFPRQMM